MIVGYMHVGKMGHWEEVNREMLTTMLDSGLLDEVFLLNFCVVGDEDAEANPPFENDGIVVNDVGKLEDYEYATQRLMYDDCVNMYGNPKWLDRSGIERVHVFYCCNAGVSHPPNHDFYPDWRLLMSYFNFTEWRRCVNALEHADIDTVGIEWQTDPVRHWSGNFWWATADYIATLPDPENMRTFDAGNGINHVTHPRHGAEWWVGMNPEVRHFSLFQTGYSWRRRPRKPWKEWLESVEYLKSLEHGTEMYGGQIDCE